jgi:hypothetical protein
MSNNAMVAPPCLVRFCGLYVLCPAWVLVRRLLLLLLLSNVPHSYLSAGCGHGVDGLNTQVVSNESARFWFLSLASSSSICLQAHYCV